MQATGTTEAARQAAERAAGAAGAASRAVQGARWAWAELSGRLTGNMPQGSALCVGELLRRAESCAGTAGHEAQAAMRALSDDGPTGPQEAARGAIASQSAPEAGEARAESQAARKRRADALLDLETMAGRIGGCADEARAFCSCGSQVDPWALHNLAVTLDGLACEARAAWEALGGGEAR